MGKFYRPDNRYRCMDRGRRRVWFYRAKIVAGIAVVCGLLSLQFASFIDCNVSHNTTPRFYRVPGQALINLLKRERWFCSEAEAVAAGWRRGETVRATEGSGL